MEGGIDIVIPWVDGNDPEWRKAFSSEKKKSAEGGVVVTGGDENTSEIRYRDLGRNADGELANPNNSVVATGGDENTSEIRYRDLGRNADGELANPNNVVVATGGDENASEIRYRDWSTLPYFFRGIEKFAPWVRRIHFVTWGHLPAWLDTSNPKLNVVRHSDYIPGEYLPTFASRPIELNVHRIEGLSERFILFNDDMFLCRAVPEERFFRNGLPCDMARLSLIAGSSISHAVLNMVEILNRRHDRREVMRDNSGKWYSLKYGAGNLLKTLDLSVWKGFAGLADTHMPQPYLKETFTKLWDEEFEVLDATCRMRFRSPMGVNHWLMRYEQLAAGEFSPVSFKDARLDSLDENRIGDIEEYVREQRYAMICLNDSPQIRDFEGVRGRLAAALEAILPEKSRFEL